MVAWRGEQERREWSATLDVARLETAGWRPVPFREFVLKIHSRCDLACDYCYMYTMADQSWHTRPMVMSPATLEATATRIAEHARAHDLSSVEVILHGGEPLLAGPAFISDAVWVLRTAMPAQAQVNISIQTNGVSLDERYLDLLKRLGVRVGVSIDGAAAAHDRHRRFANGTGSFRHVAVAVQRLASPAYRDMFGGLLCVVDVTNDPVTTYDALAAYEPPLLDFLLPHGNWMAPPPGRAAGSAATPYADWLIAAFDRWYGTERGAPKVRLFTEIMHALLGGAAATEAIGLSPAAVAVIETDGSIEQSDSLKSAYADAPYTGAHVAGDSFDALLRMPGFAARQIGSAGLCDECQKCPVVQVCGGGHYAHRYRAGRGMLNPSVYCLDLFKLIWHIRGVMESGIRLLPRATEGRLEGRWVEVELQSLSERDRLRIGMVLAERQPHAPLGVRRELSGPVLSAVRSQIKCQVECAAERHRMAVPEHGAQPGQGVLAEFHGSVSVAKRR
jgi:uncharacterized protein